ncbi:MAG: hypothetical protein AAF694_10290 [Bacteroidota bacterium]
MRATKSNQEKLQDILKAQNFTIRYEKGNFKGGYCMVMSEQIIIINKFFPLESKINTLMDIIRAIEIDESLLEPNQLKLLHNLKENA